MLTRVADASPMVGWCWSLFIFILSTKYRPRVLIFGSSILAAAFSVWCAAVSEVLHFAQRRNTIKKCTSQRVLRSESGWLGRGHSFFFPDKARHGYWRRAAGPRRVVVGLVCIAPFAGLLPPGRNHFPALYARAPRSLSRASCVWYPSVLSYFEHAGVRGANRCCMHMEHVGSQHGFSRYRVIPMNMHSPLVLLFCLFTHNISTPILAGIVRSSYVAVEGVDGPVSA